MITEYVGGHPLYNFTCDDKLIDTLLSEVDNCTYSRGYAERVGETDSTIGYTQKNGTFVSFYNEELYKWLNTCLDTLSQKHLNTFKLKIVDMWVVKSKFGEIANLHSHSLSMFSGLLYLNSCPRSETVFYYPDKFFNNWRFFLHDNVKNNEIERKISPERGKCIIWPSDLLHRALPHSQKYTRYAIAFNTFIEGASNNPTKRLNISLNNGYE
jgi:uncharacterized protein (TIGR02466 family)